MDRKKVVIIDDDKEMLVFMKEQLEVLYDVDAFSSGEEALGSMQTGDVIPDLILLDIVMNGMDGYEVLESIKANAKLKRVPVVFLTGITDDVNECRGLEMDVVDYLKKPVAGKVLLARVQHYIDLYSDMSGGGKLDEAKIMALPTPLSDNELEVARLMAEFRSDREIGDLLHISVPYVKKLVASVKDKLDIEKRGDIRKYLV
jgi:putative two-component system response regulator